MAKIKNPPVGSPDPGIELTEVETDYSADALLDEVFGLDETENTTIRVYKLLEPPRVDKIEYCFDCTVADFVEHGLATARDGYGGGFYLIRAWRRGVKGFRMSKIVRVAAPLQGAKAADGKPENSELERLRLQVEQARTEQMTFMRDTLQAALGRPQPAVAAEPVTHATVLAMIKDLREFDRRSETKPASPLTSLKELLQLKELLADELPQGESALEKIARRVLPMLAGGDKPADAPALPAVVDNPVKEDTDMMKDYVSELCDMADMGADPAKVAQRIVTAASVIEKKVLGGMVENPAWGSVLAGYDVRVNNFMPWFESLRANIQALLTAPAQKAHTAANERPGDLSVSNS